MEICFDFVDVVFVLGNVVYNFVRVLMHVIEWLFGMCWIVVDGVVVCVCVWFYVEVRVEEVVDWLLVGCLFDVVVYFVFEYYVVEWIVDELVFNVNFEVVVVVVFDYEMTQWFV